MLKPTVRALLLSDIHANLPALEAVLAHAYAGRASYQAVYSLGDALGYGPHPREALDRLRAIDARCILGNHEAALLELQQGNRPEVVGMGTQVLAWQLGRLGRRDLEWVAGWKEVLDVPDLSARLRHGTPLSLDEYLGESSARQAFAEWNGALAFVGHTHVPAAYATLALDTESSGGKAAPQPRELRLRHQPLAASGTPHEAGALLYRLPPRARLILGVGSVGQPRDGDPRAAYVVYDSTVRTLELRRVPYDIARTQRDIHATGLPDSLAERLAVGG